ncbi:MAG: hypothetical protein Q4Q17_04290 [Tissierellia bacterium]|nr:hypothetical protein [Tissierellia bacterium]
MKVKSFYLKAFVILFAITILLSIYIEYTRDRSPLRYLTSRELTPEVVGRINRLSIIYTFLIVYLLFLVAMCFFRVFQLLISPLVSGNVFKVATCFLLYLGGIIVAIRGYSYLFIADVLLSKTGKLRLDALSTVYPHVVIVGMLILAYYLKLSIVDDLKKKHEAFQTDRNEAFQKFDTLKEIMNVRQNLSEDTDLSSGEE